MINNKRDKRMNILNQFPQKVQQYLLESFGVPVTIKKLNGIKSDGGCFRIKFFNSSVIIKQTIGPQEYIFYNECTHLMQEFKKYIPISYYSYRNEENCWIVIEDVARLLPKERWYADKYLLEVLFKFHSKTWGKSLLLSNHYSPNWNNELTYAVLELIPDKISNQLQPFLFELQKESQHIFKPYCWVHADTNPTNWGIRKDGTLVLFDWERISCASPAIDLAITIPGLGTTDSSVESLIAKRYIAMWSKLSGGFSFTEQKLFQEIKLAKLWSVVEYVANNWTSLEHEMLNNLLNKLSIKIYELI